MAEKRVLIFAGTTEGRMLAEYLAGRAVRVHICVATEYGASLLPEGGNITASHDRLDAAQMERLMRELAPDYVVDATHPYAEAVTRNVQEACRACERAYLRLVRESSGADGCIYASDVEEAVSFLSGTKGNILAATGSKELEKYTELPDYKERLYARVLSVAPVVERCEQLGIRGRRLICMQGPFSVEMNAAMLREYEIQWLVTKESGKAGGFPEKCEAARQAGARLVVIGRPQREEAGYTLKELCTLLEGSLWPEKRDKPRREIALVGIGTGHEDYLTVRAREACHQAELIIGAKRVAMAAARPGQEVFFEYRAAEIVRYIKEHPEYRKVAVAFSGDVGFYSGAQKLLAALREDEELQGTQKLRAARQEDEELQGTQKLRAARQEDEELQGMHKGQPTDIEVIPGISSVVYFCAKLGISWEDAALVSMHGKSAHLISVVRDHEKTIALAGSPEDIRGIGLKMAEYGYGNLSVFTGESLSCAGERITEFAAAKLSQYEGSGLAVLYIHNPEGGRRLMGLPDDSFIRGNVPMTKEEVRSVSLAKLRLKADGIVCDIGAGTGSVAVEAALCAVRGRVYAIEMKAEAAALISENRRKYRTDNLFIIEGEAPGALEGLPAPDCVFIGGSRGRLWDILQKLVEKMGKDAKMRVVANAVTLETLSEAMRCLKDLKKDARVQVLEEETVQLSVARSEHAGRYHMMKGQNPVFVISFTLKTACSPEGSQ